MLDQSVNEYDDIDFEPDYGTITDELCQSCKNGYYIKCMVNEFTTTWTCNACGAVESN